MHLGTLVSQFQVGNRFDCQKSGHRETAMQMTGSSFVIVWKVRADVTKVHFNSRAVQFKVS
jgi:hypothetical protein